MTHQRCRNCESTHRLHFGGLKFKPLPYFYCQLSMYITICPVIVVEISRAAKSDNAVLLLETVDMDQPAAVEFALLPSFCPGAGVVREQVFVARLRVTNRVIELSTKFHSARNSDSAVSQFHIYLPFLGTCLA